MLHYAYKYGGDFEGAMLANANGGGECVARGMLLGALLGAAHGASRIPQGLKHGLVAYTSISREIDAFVAAIPRPQCRRLVGKSSSCDSAECTDCHQSVATGSEDIASRASSTSRAIHEQVFLRPPQLPLENDDQPPQPPPAGLVSLMLQSDAG